MEREETSRRLIKIGQEVYDEVEYEDPGSRERNVG